MNLTKNEKIVLEHLQRENIKVIPDNLSDKFTPETLHFTLSQLQAKGLVEYLEGAYTTTKDHELMRKKITASDVITAYGHPQVLSTNPTTLEITREKTLTKRGDCIIAVKADKGCADINPILKDFLKLGKPVKIKIGVGDVSEEITAYGSPALELSDRRSIVIRKSDHIDGRTLAIFADKAANDLKGGLVERLKDSESKVIVSIEVET